MRLVCGNPVEIQVVLKDSTVTKIFDKAEELSTSRMRCQEKIYHLLEKRKLKGMSEDKILSDECCRNLFIRTKLSEKLSDLFKDYLKSQAVPARSSRGCAL